MVREAGEESARVLQDVEESAELVKAAREETSRRVEEVPGFTFYCLRFTVWSLWFTVSGFPFEVYGVRLKVNGLRSNVGN